LCIEARLGKLPWELHTVSEGLKKAATNALQSRKLTLTSLRPDFITGVFPERGACLTGEFPALLISTSALMAAKSSWSCRPFCLRRLECDRVPVLALVVTLLLLSAAAKSLCDQLLGVVPFVAEL
jgi:hypothetical protein